MIDYLYDVITGIADTPQLDKKLANTLKYIGNHESRRLKKYNVERLGENETKDILSSLQLIASTYKIAEKLSSEQAATVKEIKNIYETTIDKYAPYVLNY